LTLESPHDSASRRSSSALLRPLILGVAFAGLLALVLVLGGREVELGARVVTFEDSDGAASALARRAVEAGVADEVTLEELEMIIDRLRSNAAEGDPQAALVMFEIARIQARARAAAAAPPTAESP